VYIVRIGCHLKDSRFPVQPDQRDLAQLRDNPFAEDETYRLRRLNEVTVGCRRRPKKRRVQESTDRGEPGREYQTQRNRRRSGQAAAREREADPQ
jgi:hypothetical protein